MTLSLLFAFALVLSFVTIDGTCFNKCRFQFCFDVPYFFVGEDNDVAFTGPICLSYGKEIGHIDETGEARLIGDYHYPIPISQYQPYGLKQNFSKSFFKSYNTNKYYDNYGYADRSGVGHESPQQNQADFLDARCWALPIKAYQLLSKKGDVVDNKHPRGDPLSDCISFETFTEYS